VAADPAYQERDFPWQRGSDNNNRASQPRAERGATTSERRSFRVEHHESVAGATGLGAGFPGLPQLLREAAQAITGAEARALAAEEQMGEAIRASEERVRTAEARAKAAEELAQSLEKRASDAIRAADRRADLAEERARAAEAGARAAEDWVMRIRRVLNEDP
jgi:hypothetical protein